MLHVAFFFGMSGCVFIFFLLYTLISLYDAQFFYVKFLDVIPVKHQNCLVCINGIVRCKTKKTGLLTGFSWGITQ